MFPLCQKKPDNISVSFGNFPLKKRWKKKKEKYYVSEYKGEWHRWREKMIEHATSA